MNTHNLAPNTIVIVHYTDNLDRKQSVKTTYTNAKNLLIELLEREQVDQLRDIYYTVNGITKKADYYNWEMKL